MPTFEEIGLREELLRTLEEEDITSPTALQQAIIPALRRGGNVVARASSGSGKTLAYTLGILDRLAVPSEESDEARVGPRLLVLSPTREAAEHVGLAIVPYAVALGHHVAVPGTGWGVGLSESSIVVATPDDVDAAVRTSAIKLDTVESVVIDGAESIVQLGDWERADALVDLVPRDAQRLVIAAKLDEPIEDLIERRVKRALRYPAERAVPDRRPVTPAGEIAYLIATGKDKLRLLASQLTGRESDGPPPVIFCRTDERAADLAESLAVRGFVVGSPDDDDADVTIVAAGVSRVELAADVDDDLGQTISFDVPADAAALLARHGGDPDGVVLIEPHELAHLRELARQANVTATAAPTPRDGGPTADALEAYRNELRDAVRQEDIAAQMLILEPLFDEFTPAELAAAASALLRSRRPANAAPARQPAPAAEPSKREHPAANREHSAPAGPAPVTWARLFVSVGSRDDVRPADLVGTLAGEADIPGSRIGKIEIRDSFSIVEVQADVADKVIRAVNGTTLKGRSIRVDYDRGGPARRPPPRGGPARRTTRRPPGG